jgi:spermidine/putrescine transport system substrate-binding protein
MNHPLTSMRRLIGAASLIVLMLVTACGPKKPELHLYNWADYLDDSVLRDFEKAFDCRVVVDYFDSNESMYAKIRAGASGYDVIFPSSYQAAMMMEEGLLKTLDPQKIPNLANLDPQHLKIAAIDKLLQYSAPYMTGTTGLAVRGNEVPAITASWSAILNPEVKQRTTLLNDMRETLGAALKALGFSANTLDETELRAAADLVIRWKSNIAKFENEQYKPGIASGEFLLVHGYSGDILQVISDNPESGIRYLLPEEGFTVWCDDMVIPTTASNPDLAHAFINFMLDPAIAARSMEFCQYKAPVLEAYPLLDEELRSNEAVFVPEQLMEKAEVIRPVGDFIRSYSREWDRVKATQ